MVARQLLLRMAENNAWANDALFAACGELTEEDYRATRVSFFPSIRGTLEHNYLVDVFYLDALRRGGHGRAMYAAPDPTFATCADLLRAQREVDRQLVAFVASLPDDDALDEIVPVERPSGDQPERVGDLLAHLFQHQIHHRGQAHAMLAGTTVKPPQLDEFFLAEDQRARAQGRAVT
jgi:uncharacterized damage-inducible protein DinB